MTTAAIREKLHEYINVADDRKVEAIFTIVESDLMDTLNIWESEEFLNELDIRIKDIESGNAKFSTWEEVKLKARSR